MNIDSQKGLYKCFSCGAGGDVFHFVREYDFLDKPKGEAKMSFPAAVQYVAKEFCGDAPLNLPSAPSSNTNTYPSKNDSLAMRHKKTRIHLTNAAAADYYARQLITLPAAGVARSHLLGRSIAPGVVRVFALGYAPDAYFGKDRVCGGNY